MVTCLEIRSPDFVMYGLMLIKALFVLEALVADVTFLGAGLAISKMHHPTTFQRLTVFRRECSREP
jgi:hypothetical protein